MERSDSDHFGFSVRNVCSAQNQFPVITQAKRIVDQTGEPVEEMIAEERESSSAQIRTMLNEQRKRLSLSIARKFLITNSLQPLSCHDDVWLHEQATMNRAHNSLVDEQLAQIQSAHDGLLCFFADHKTMQIRPATLYDLTAESRICLWTYVMHQTANSKQFANTQKYMKPYTLTAQHNDDSPNDDSLRALSISCSICAVAQWNRIRLGTPVWVFATICLDSSDRLLRLERISIFTSIPRNELRKLQWNPPSHNSSGLVRRDGGTVLSSPRGQRRQLEHWRR